MDINEIIALWVLGNLRSDELPKIAYNWLNEGMDSPSLRILAGEKNPIMSEAGPLFENVLKELNVIIPNTNEALLTLGKYYAKEILEKRMTPYAGARRIWIEVSHRFKPSSPLLNAFIGAASEIEDLPERSLQDGYDRSKYKNELEEIIINSSKELLNIKSAELLASGNQASPVART